jgi:hypothetical protein
MEALESKPNTQRDGANKLMAFLRYTYNKLYQVAHKLQLILGKTCILRVRSAELCPEPVHHKLMHNKTLG